MSYNELLSNSDLAKSFSTLTDPRVKRTQKHNMMDIIFITICAVICGADQWTEIEEFGHAKYDWFVSFLELPNGIPSHDTFNRLFAILNPEEFKKCFIHWINSIKDKNIKNTIIPIDGKTVRGSYDKDSSKSAIHIVSAWCSENNIVLGQIKTEEKSNEITAIPELLNLIDITDSIITIDAMGCQKAIAAKITALQGDYILSLKGNQNNLFNKVIDFFAFSIDVTPAEELSKLVTLTEEEYKAITELDHKKDKTELEIAKKEIQDDPSLLYGYEKDAVVNSYYEYADTNNHGRKEIRKYHIASNLPWIEEESINWHNLQTIGCVERIRIINGKATREFSYYISSIENDAQLFAKGTRAHWNIENKLHWSLDVAFREDANRTRLGHSPENLSLLRQIALNCLKNETSLKRGIKTKRLKAGWDEKYLLKVLRAFREQKST